MPHYSTHARLIIINNVADSYRASPIFFLAGRSTSVGLSFCGFALNVLYIW